jgi:hypothetical protein
MPAVSFFSLRILSFVAAAYDVVRGKKLTSALNAATSMIDWKALTITNPSRPQDAHSGMMPAPDGSLFDRPQLHAMSWNGSTLL